MALIKKDKYINGIIMAILLPVITSCLVLPAGRLLTFFDSNILLLSLIPNLLFMRYYIVKAQFERTGKGILIITVLLMAAYFIFAHGHPFNLPL
jgi:hypothetical protein